MYRLLKDRQLCIDVRHILTWRKKITCHILLLWMMTAYTGMWRELESSYLVLRMSRKAARWCQVKTLPSIRSWFLVLCLALEFEMKNLVQSTHPILLTSLLMRMCYQLVLHYILPWLTYIWMSTTAPFRLLFFILIGSAFCIYMLARRLCMSIEEKCTYVCFKSKLKVILNENHSSFYVCFIVLFTSRSRWNFWLLVRLYFKLLLTKVNMMVDL